MVFVYICDKVKGVFVLWTYYVLMSKNISRLATQYLGCVNSILEKKWLIGQYIHDLIDTNTPLFIHLTLTIYFKLAIHPNDVIFIIIIIES